MNIETLSKKAHAAKNKMHTYCASIVLELLKNYKSTRDKYTETLFCEDVQCFIQTGDGLALTDQYGGNIPVKYISAIINDKGYFTFDDFEQNKI